MQFLHRYPQPKLAQKCATEIRSHSMRLLKRYFAMIALAAAYAAGQTTEPTTQLPTRSQVQDPGPRGGTPAAGGPISGLTPALQAVFTTGQANFQEVEDVPTGGLGPRFNSTSCSSCHFQPAIGGSSPASNPQVAFANSQNRLPSFITAKGPVREVRFISNPDGTPDGGVHDLFTIAGRSDTPQGCNLQQPDFSNSSNIIYRIPTPTFGLGLIEAIQDTTLIQNVAQSASQRLGIAGTLNRNGNDGTVTRFGWKAQNKSLLMFSGEAYNVEMGITNLLFNTERDETPDCSPLAPANSYWNIGGLVDQKVFDDITNFANFMRFLAAPTRAVAAAADNTAVEGSNQFVNIGCGNCHTPALQTGASPFPGLANQTIHPYSDFALHHMGPGLADHISQGLAAGDQFRSAPLWGIGQRLFFLHDGRETDLMKVIADHASNANSQFPASEANQVVQNFNNLSNSDQQAILNFLRSL
jgi:CxxC motif-containing protein (DUF1111 family)